jgi:A/G-specific adenine glycosylase
MTPEQFQAALFGWFKIFGRKDLPWQKNVTPYRVWVSEIMLQQTQVTTVISYFEQFMEKFPTVQVLANAELDEVLHRWSGLGYYARARNLHKAAGIINKQGFPETKNKLMALPGIGESTAGAILSIAFKQSHAILDGNVKRVLCRYMAIEGWPGRNAINKLLWEHSRYFTPENNAADYTQAIMDLGATVCKRSSPLCTKCPICEACKARQLGRVNDFPTSKPKKNLPAKKRVFLILKNDKKEIFLEKRAPAGIWGGLWSLPEFSDIESIMAWCQIQKINTENFQRLASKRHTFSHYHLDYSAIIINHQNPVNYIAEAGETIWYDKSVKNTNVGLPAPIKKLIDHI